MASIKTPINVEACVLAGGQSRRMGRAKSSVRVAGKSMLTWVRRAAEAAGLPTRIIREDVIPRCGPIGGIYTALKTSPAKAVLFLPCDMPFLSAGLITALISAFGRARAVCVSVDGRVNFPLMLRTEDLRVVERLITQKKFSIHELVRSLRGRKLLAPSERADQLFNINTPEDLLAAKKKLRNGALDRFHSTAARGNLVSAPMKIRGQRPVLDISDLRLVRGGTVILDRLSWRVERGEHWVILGANGSGKTSLLSALTGYMMPTAGEISLLGRRFGETHWRDLRKRIGLVSSSIRQMMAPQEPAIETVVSGKYAMIDFWGPRRKTDDARARKILRQIECLYLRDRPWAFLSQGERQRVLIGRALMGRPDVLILDEPCAGLDPAARENFLYFLQNWAAGKNCPSLVLVSHHVEEIMPCFTHVLLLKNGRVLAAGEKDAMMNSRLLSETFGIRARVRRQAGRYSLILSSKGAVVI